MVEICSIRIKTPCKAVVMSHVIIAGLLEKVGVQKYADVVMGRLLIKFEVV